MKDTCELVTSSVQIVQWLVYNQARKLWHRICHEDENKYQGLITASVSVSDWICTEGHNLHTGHFSQTHSSNEGMHSGSNDPSAELFP